MDLVPRVDGEQVDPDRFSVVGLYRIHIKSAENTHTDAVSIIWITNIC